MVPRVDERMIGVGCLWVGGCGWVGGWWGGVGGGGGGDYLHPGSLRGAPSGWILPRAREAALRSGCSTVGPCVNMSVHKGSHWEGKATMCALSELALPCLRASSSTASTLPHPPPRSFFGYDFSFIW